MKVLIAGASGALGTPLTRALIAKGHEVLGVARSPQSMDHLSHLGAHPILANVMDRDDLLRAVKGVQADAVIHALTALKKTPLRHQDMYATNALRDGGTTNLLAAAREVGARRFVAESIHFLPAISARWRCRCKQVADNPARLNQSKCSSREAG